MGRGPTPPPHTQPEAGSLHKREPVYIPGRTWERERERAEEGKKRG